MKTSSSLRWTDLLWFVLVVVAAAGVRFWYLSEVAAPAPTGQLPFLAQSPTPTAPGTAGKILGKDEPSAQDELINNIRESNSFTSRAPLSTHEENTAHVAPGYPWLAALVYRFVDEKDAVTLIRWIQCGLGALTVGLYFVFARLVFGSLPVALLTGLFGAVNPFWVINTAQLEDGVVTTALLACTLVFGARAARSGDAFASLLFGLSLAGLSLVRAALLPFAFLGLLWFLSRCRELPRGWFVALLAMLGFVNGVAPWAVRNYQTFGDVIPVADSAWLHLWMGNNPGATGGEMDSADMAVALAKLDSADKIGPADQGRLEKLQQEQSQHKRYKMLAKDALQFMREHPDQAVKNRMLAGLYFFLGQDWFRDKTPGETSAAQSQTADWLRQRFPLIINAALLGMLLLALLGWRWTHVWRGSTGLATLALVWVPLPYVLSHAESLWGPRLPLDGVLLGYAAFALVYMVPGLRGQLTEGPQVAGLREI